MKKFHDEYDLKNENRCTFDDNNKFVDMIDNKYIIDIDKYDQISTKEYIKFLNGECQTNNGVNFEEILYYNDIELEEDHGYIQWIFPLDEKSSCAIEIPIIDLKELTQEIANDNSITKKIKLSYELMMNHWGLNNRRNLIKINLLNGHDALRLSRMLQSLVYHGLKDLAFTTYEIVSQYSNYTGSILKSLMYYGETIETMKPVKNNSNVRQGHLYMDVWKFHLLKACNKMNKLLKN